MISLGILDGVGPAGTRRRLSRYRLFALVVGICLAVITGSHFSHGSHNQQPFDLQKRSILDEPLGFNDSLVSLPHGLVSRAADDVLWAKKVRSGKWSVKMLLIIMYEWEQAIESTCFDSIQPMLSHAAISQY
jgi:hypothetical protein